MDRTHAELKTKYAGSDAAQRYHALHRGKGRHRREERCVAAALAELPAGGRVLDLPCGTGRMFPLLTSLGFDVVGADLSTSMLEVARDDAERPAGSGRVLEIREVDVFDTPFEDGEFDAVLCNRFLHHLEDSERRVAALRELRRVSRGPVVASFFCSQSYDGLRARMKHRRSEHRSDRHSIRFDAFRRDLAASGLRVVRVHRALSWISQQWYVVAAAI